MNIDEFTVLLSRYMSHHPDQRLGQAAFNMLYEIFPEEVGRLRGSMVDPFYNDNKINNFLTALGILS